MAQYLSQSPAAAGLVEFLLCIMRSTRGANPLVDGAPITGEAEPAGVNPAYPACGSQPVVSSSTTSSSSAMTWTTGACSLT